MLTYTESCSIVLTNKNERGKLMSLMDLAVRFVVSAERIADNLEKLVRANEQREADRVVTVTPEPVEKAKKAKKPAPEPEPIPVEGDASDLRKILRQEFKSVVIARGEKVAEELLAKYNVRETSDIADVDVPDFLTDAAMLIDSKDVKADEVKSELPKVDKKKLKAKLTFLAKMKKKNGEEFDGRGAAIGIVKSFGIKHLDDLDPINYVEAYNNTMDAIGG